MGSRRETGLVQASHQRGLWDVSGPERLTKGETNCCD